MLHSLSSKLFTIWNDTVFQLGTREKKSILKTSKEWKQLNEFDILREFATTLTTILLWKKINTYIRIYINVSLLLYSSIKTEKSSNYLAFYLKKSVNNLVKKELKIQPAVNGNFKRQ